MQYRANIGLEVHLQLSTKSKAFCSCSAQFGGSPNSQTCPVCLGLPGSLPVLNKSALMGAIKTAVALNCDIAGRMKFDRKNYYYPDLPKNFQISQYDKPLAKNGFLEMKIGGTLKRIGVLRVHIEEDAGKLFHQSGYSLVDYNRAGTPLLEIVSKPEISSPEEAYLYLTALKSLIRYLDVSDCNMEEGSLRCDANVSLRKENTEKLGVKTEIKNMNSFKGVRQALDCEIKRQASFLSEGEKVIQETRLWDADGGVTTSMRSKEEAHDYRYFPEPDLLPFTIEEALIERIKSDIPELPRRRQGRLVSQYGIPEYDASVLTQEKMVADFFEEAVKVYYNPKALSNWIMRDVSGALKDMNTSIEQIKLTPRNLANMVKMVDDGIISIIIAKKVLSGMIESGEGPDRIVEKKGLSQISDSAELGNVINKVMEENEKSVNDYKSGKKQALAFLIGQVMKATGGKANPKLVNDIVIKRLNS